MLWLYTNLVIFSLSDPDRNLCLLYPSLARFWALSTLQSLFASWPKALQGVSPALKRSPCKATEIPHSCEIPTTRTSLTLPWLQLHQAQWSEYQTQHFVSPVLSVTPFCLYLSVCLCLSVSPPLVFQFLTLMRTSAVDYQACPMAPTPLRLCSLWVNWDEYFYCSVAPHPEDSDWVHLAPCPTVPQASMLYVISFLTWKSFPTQAI